MRHGSTSSDGRDLTTTWLYELRWWWEYFSDQYLTATLRPPTFAIEDSSARLGSWHSERRSISIARRHITEDPWIDVLETLRHEMAHQLADEVLHAGDEPPHGPAFQRACEMLRVGAAARSSCSDRTHARGDERLQRKVEKLLSLATSRNEHEAQVAMQKARELLLTSAAERVPARQYEIRQVGDLKRRHERWEYQLASILTDYFLVEAIWADSFDPAQGQHGSRLEIYGTVNHLEMAAYVHRYLTRLLPELWTQYKRDHRIRGNRDRRSYYSGVLSGFRGKLAEQDQARRRANALVPTGRDPGLVEFYRYVNPRIRTVGGSAMRVTDAYNAGISDGRGVTIRKPLESSGGFGGFLSD